MEIIILIALLIFFGILTSYQDIKYSKIKNKMIIFILLTGVIINIIDTFFYGFSMFFYSITNLVISFLLSFFLWNIGVLPGGDAKLLIALSFFIPPSVYSYVYIEIFPAISIYLNTFIPLSIGLILMSFYYGGIGSIKKALASTFNIKTVARILFFTISILGILKISLESFNIKHSMIFYFILLFSIIYTLRSLKIDIIKFSIPFFLLSTIFYYKYIFTLSYLFSTIFLTFLILFLTFIVLLIDEVYSKEIKIENLTPGMKLAEVIIKDSKKNTYVKENFSLRFIFDILLLSEKRIKGALISLDKETIDEMKKLRKEGKLDFDSIRVISTINLAPFIFLGALITVLFHGNNILYVLYSFLIKIINL